MQKERERERERERDGKGERRRQEESCLQAISAAIGIYRPPGSVSITNSSNFNHYLP